MSSATELDRLIRQLTDAGVTNVVFDPTLMRGFDYYTDIVFEVFDTNPENNRSMFGGGRYDGLVGMFGVEPVPTAGFGMGDVTLINFLETHKLLPALRPETDLYIACIGEVAAQVMPVAAELREMGVNVAVDTTGRKPDRQIKAAVKKGIRYVMFVGEKELAEQQYSLKDLVTGSEQIHGLQRIVSIVKDFRHS
jgi:histidyl-tRNA synthetase